MISKYLLAVFHQAVWLCCPSECFTNLKRTLGPADIRGSAHVCCPCFSVGELHFHSVARPHTSSIRSLSHGSAWKKWALDSATPPSYRETSSGVLPVGVSLCGLCGQVGGLFLMYACAGGSITSCYRVVIRGLSCCQQPCQTDAIQSSSASNCTFYEAKKCTKRKNSVLIKASNSVSEWTAFSSNASHLACSDFILQLWLCNQGCIDCTFPNSKT